MIFENGYLKREHVNPNYRGLVGWPTKFVWTDGGASFGKLLAVQGSYIFNTEYIEEQDIKFFIKQFTPEEIPVGELCWVGYCCDDISSEDDSIQWTITVYDPEEWFCSLANYIVPYLIAGTAERAEELKDWHRG